MKFMYAIGGTSLGIWGWAFLASVVVFTPVASVRLSLPLQPSWSRHLIREDAHLDALGGELDLAKAMLDNCPVTKQWDSLEVMFETLVVVRSRMKALTMTIKEASGEERAKLLKKYNNLNHEKIISIANYLNSLITSIGNTLEYYKLWDRAIRGMPSRETPRANLRENLIILSFYLESGKVQTEDGKTMVSFDSDGRRNFLERWYDLILTSEKVMRYIDKMMPRAAEIMGGQEFAKLFRNRHATTDPDIWGAEPDTDDDNDNNNNPGEDQAHVEGDVGSNTEGNAEGDAEANAEGGEGGGEGGMEVEEPANTNGGMEADGLNRFVRGLIEGTVDYPKEEYIYGMTEHLQHIRGWFVCWRQEAESVLQRAERVREVPYPTTWAQSFFS
ncbi:hypothetical protein TWF730_010671 [Orbilia blumenaviensis]|uniref:Uncharacterized protein n=1 Tax=Orbilia blumenaviensis TaxID=1796055 RepID=A0AAV9USB9_9PEZI